MTESKTDLRVVRTRKLIRDAFMDMVGEVGVARITVKDLAERAAHQSQDVLSALRIYRSAVRQRDE